MGNVYNFCAGPCLLPQEVYEQSAKAILNFENTGMSILSISHRSKEFIAVLEEARQLAIELLQLESKGYEALFLQGGASMEFLRVPYNLMRNKSAYIDTGVWSGKAIDQAKLFGDVVCVGSSAQDNYSSIPIHINQDLNEFNYLHFTSNNTIYGTQFQTMPISNSKIPIVCDMSSDIYSRVFDYDKIDLIYAGAQKNIGPAGVSLILVKPEILGKTERKIPQMLNYKEHLDKDSLYHTANVFAIYTCLLNFRWLKNQGGVAVIEEKNKAKANLFYNTIDNLDFVEGMAKPEFRSKMNAVFKFKEQAMNTIFDTLCEQANIKNVKGHRAIGGYRASMYNALSLESVQKLTDVLNHMKTLV